MGIRRRVLCLATVLLATAFAVAACSGSPRPAPGASSRERPTARTMRFVLGDRRFSPVATQVPAAPLATTPTFVPGLTLQLYVAERVGRDAVLVVFALDVPSPGISVGTETQIDEALSAAGSIPTGKPNAWDAVSGVSLFDPAGLKQYQTYMADPANDDTCLCTIGLSGYNFVPGDDYFAALLAAPPGNVTSVSFVTGLGTIGDVTLSR